MSGKFIRWEKRRKRVLVFYPLTSLKCQSLWLTLQFNSLLPAFWALPASTVKDLGKRYLFSDPFLVTRQTSRMQRVSFLQGNCQGKPATWFSLHHFHSPTMLLTSSKFYTFSGPLFDSLLVWMNRQTVSFFLPWRVTTSPAITSSTHQHLTL